MLNIFNKFDIIPACIIKTGQIIFFNNEFEKEFGNDFKTFLELYPEKKIEFQHNKKTYNVYSISNDDNIILIFCDITNKPNLSKQKIIHIDLIDINYLPQTGIKLIDDQHKKLATCVNNCILNFKNNDTLQNLIYNILLLIDETRYHFTTEEFLMEQHDVFLLNHLEEHKKLLSELEMLLLNLSIDNIERILYYLTSWLMIHIRFSDIKLKKQLGI